MKYYILLPLLLILLSTPRAWRDTAEAADGLQFDSTAYALRTMTLDGRSITFRAYEDRVYVEHPVDPQYQRMNIYVPAAYFTGESLGGFTAETAPIFFPITVGGYMPGEPDTPGEGHAGGANAVFVALSKGYVVAAPGARGRVTRDQTGRYTGKAPACIVDLKAAVRYLRHNDAAMAGDAERIITNGTSAGGALSALLGATGNNQEYESYLRELGAADARDDVFAASCYCPITNLEHADMAYEWLLSGCTSYRQMQMGSMTDWHVERKEIEGRLDAGQIQVSSALKALFPAYVNGLGLTRNDGTALTLDQTGNGSFKEYVASFVVASAQRTLAEGTDLSGIPWLTLRDGTVTAIDFDQYVQHMGRMKTPPAFDALDLSSGENGLFGTATLDARHFTPFGMAKDTASGTMAGATVVKLMNPMDFIGAKDTTVAGHWRIRHGTVDKDTSLAIPVILATRLMNAGYAVDFALPWERPHSGDYDLDSLFEWMTACCR
jgi:hypothetical protein